MRQKTCKTCGKSCHYSDGGTGLYCVEHKRSAPDLIPFEKLSKDRSKRLRLIKERGHQCEICKMKMWMKKPIPLTLDHIDGNSDNGSKENLRIICWNCHAQTPTFGSKNSRKFPGTKRQKSYRRLYIAVTNKAPDFSHKEDLEGSNPSVTI